MIRGREQQAVQLGHISGKQKIEDLSAAVGKDLVTTGMPRDDNQDT